LLFQTLDNKKECYAIFCDDELYYYPNALELTRSWKYTPHFNKKHIEYAHIWSLGKSLDEVCPEQLRPEWSTVQKTGRAFLTSFREAKIDLDDVCFYDLVPKKFLLQYCDIKNKITEHVFQTFKKPGNYDFLLQLFKFTHEISRQRLNIQTENLNFSDPHIRKICGKIHNVPQYIRYNPWGTLTGRMTVDKDSFPILTLNKELRKAIKPNNDIFVELDYNAAEIRTLLALAGEKQPDRDIHNWLSDKVFDSKYDREQTKKKVFAWLYNPRATNKKLSQYIDKRSILKTFYCNGIINTPFGRNIEAGESKALNYLVQSTASDIFLRSALEVNDILKDKKSNIAFCIHDSLVIDLCKEEKGIIQDLKDIFSRNKFGDFKVNLSIGTNFGEMRKIE